MIYAPKSRRLLKVYRGQSFSSDLSLPPKCKTVRKIFLNQDFNKFFLDEGLALIKERKIIDLEEYDPPPRDK